MNFCLWSIFFALNLNGAPVWNLCTTNWTYLQISPPLAATPTTHTHRLRTHCCVSPNVFLFLASLSLCSAVNETPSPFNIFKPTSQLKVDHAAFSIKPPAARSLWRSRHRSLSEEPRKKLSPKPWTDFCHRALRGSCLEVSLNLKRTELSNVLLHLLGKSELESNLLNFPPRSVL